MIQALRRELRLVFKVFGFVILYAAVAAYFFDLVLMRE